MQHAVPALEAGVGSPSAKHFVAVLLEFEMKAVRVAAGASKAFVASAVGEWIVKNFSHATVYYTENPQMKAMAQVIADFHFQSLPINGPIYIVPFDESLRKAFARVASVHTSGKVGA